MTLIFEPEPAHHCRTVLEGRLSPTPAPGSVAQCTCGQFLVVDERTGRWAKAKSSSRVVRDALAHYDERRGDR